MPLRETIKKWIGKTVGFQKEINLLQSRIDELSWDQPFGMWTRTAFLQFCRIMPRGTRTVIFIDLDRVHNLNSQLGYTKVDEMIKKAFDISFRRSDLVARWYSGDEIIILLDTGRDKAEMNYPAASHEVSTGKIRSKGEASFGELNPPMGD
jgi:GGDEF domain-containing protein